MVVNSQFHVPTALHPGEEPLAWIVWGLGEPGNRLNDFQGKLISSTAGNFLCSRRNVRVVSLIIPLHYLSLSLCLFFVLFRLRRISGKNVGPWLRNSTAHCAPSPRTFWSCCGSVVEPLEWDVTTKLNVLYQRHMFVIDLQSVLCFITFFYYFIFNVLQWLWNRLSHLSLPPQWRHVCISGDTYLVSVRTLLTDFNVYLFFTYTLYFFYTFLFSRL